MERVPCNVLTIRLVLVGLAVFWMLSGSSPYAQKTQWTSHAPPSSPELLATGKAVYDRQCAACHGVDGGGDGEAAYLLFPKPRDFTAARYRLVSTWEGIATDDDLFATISRGMPGSAMPSWAHLQEETRWGLVHYIKSLSERPLVTKPATDPRTEGEQGTGVISVPPEPPYDAEARKQAAYLFEEGCAGCHGQEGRGDGSQRQIDSEGYATRPRDLTRGIFKGSPNAEDVYRRIVAGIPGTPMPMSDWAYGEYAWHLVHLVLSMSDAAQREGSLVRSSQVVARKVRRLSARLDDPIWSKHAPTRVALMPLRWRDNRVEALHVQAAHDGRRLAIKLSWQDSEPNESVVLQGGFTDGAAIQFSEEATPPLFAMGTPESAVNIWHWKAVWQKDETDGAVSLVDVFPNMSRDLYQGTPHGGGYMTARSVANPLAQGTHPSPVEDANAGGLGTLTSQPRERQNVDGSARWLDGRWEVVFVRDLKSKQTGDIQLAPGRRVSFALAIWDGAAEDRNGQKSVSIWQKLALAK